MPQADPWTSFLDWLTTIIVPDWSALVSLLPVFVVLGVLGPGLSLIVLLHLHHRFTRRRGRVRYAELEPEPAPLGPDGEPDFPANTPFCPQHALVHPATDRRCAVDGEDLSVRCPVDGVTRLVGQEICRACGTRYVLGAARTALTVRRKGAPPEGGAAIA